MITLNALTAADSVIIPVQAQYLPAKGMTQLLSTIAKVKKPFSSTSPSATKRKRRNHKGYTVSENLLT